MGNVRMDSRLTPLIALGIAVVALGGCVMTEKYDAEKARALNFQRLLAQEEKRTGELDAEVKRLKRESTEQDAKARELTAQLQAVREQLVKAQEDVEVAREAATRKPEPRKKAAARPEPAKPEAVKPDDLTSPDGGLSDLSTTGERQFAPPPSSRRTTTPSPTAEAGAEPRYHAVKPGENLFRIGKKYGASVDKLREWNNLSNNDIEVGQKLIVGYE